jgi:hypothetical protein
MTKQLPTSDETPKNAFDFYNTYLSVIYGLLATQGLTSVVTFTSKGDEQAWDVLSILLFGGTFITTMRLWFGLANIDDLTRKSYGIVVRLKHSNFNCLLLVDATFATTFAGLLLAMFSAIPSQTLFFLLFLWLAGLSLLYDSVSGLLFYHFTKGIDDDHDVIPRYKAKVQEWVKQDLVFATAATALYIVDKVLRLSNSVTLSLTFVLLTIVQLVVGFFPHWSAAVRKFLGRSGAHA